MTYSSKLIARLLHLAARCDHDQFYHQKRPVPQRRRHTTTREEWHCCQQHFGGGGEKCERNSAAIRRVEMDTKFEGGKSPSEKERLKWKHLRRTQKQQHHQIWALYSSPQNKEAIKYPPRLEREHPPIDNTLSTSTLYADIKNGKQNLSFFLSRFWFN